jgi:hypothetical protein
MCLPVTSQSRRTRTFLCIGLFCLAFSLGSQNFHLIGSSLLHFVRGLLMGVAIAMIFHSALLANRLRHKRRA